MPGVRPHDMDIEFEGATLAISGFRYKNISVGSTPGAPVEDGKKVTSKYMLTLPVKVGADIPNARVDYGGYGVLNVTIPIVRTRKIEIQEVWVILYLEDSNCVALFSV